MNPLDCLSFSRSSLARAFSVILGIVVFLHGTLQADTTGLSYDAPGNLTAIQTNIQTAGLPVLVSQPAGKVTPSGGGVSFSVNVTSGSPVTYQWQLNGVNISGATGDSLFIPNATLGNEGSYTVVITNATGSITSAAAVLAVDTAEVVAWGYNDYGEGTVPPGLSNVVAVAAGRDHSLALKSDGTVVSWGRNQYGQAAVPAGLSNVVAIAAGANHSLAVKSDGTVLAWGNNGTGAVSVPAGLSNVIAVAGGEYHSLALRSDGTVVGWGSTSAGATPPPTASAVISIAAGVRHSLALRSDGTVVAWGDNANGQSTVPANLSNAIAVAAGFYHGLVLRSDGTVAAWGYNASGQTTIPAGLNNVVAIAAGDFFSLALKADGTVVSWGDSGSGLQVVPPGLGSVAAISASSRHSLALLRANPRIAQPMILNSPAALAGFGSVFKYAVVTRNHATSYAATGLPTGLSIDAATGIISGTPTESGTFAVTISATNAFGTSQSNLTLTVNRQVPVLTSANQVLAPGGAAFTYQITATNSPTSYAAAGLPAGLSINPGTGAISGIPSSAGAYTVALSITNIYGTASATLVVNVQTVIGWGNDSAGQRTPPVGLSNVLSIAGGYDYSLAVKSDGTVVGWGDTNERAIPPGLSSVVAVAIGGRHTLALKSNGTVTAWGNNTYGQTTIPAGLNGVVAIATGFYSSLALKSDGTVIAWGYNDSGQTTIPAGLNGVVAISAGVRHALALKADGTVVGWGSNIGGETTIPAGLNSVVAIAAGNSHSLALRSDGTVIGFGNNVSGQTTLPAGLSNVVAMAAGASHSLALKSDGTVVGWGSNNYGLTTNPAGLDKAVAIAAGGNHSLALVATEAGVANPVILNSPFALAGINSAFTYRVVAKNNPTSYGATGLPAGLAINTATGLISGTPTQAGQFTVTLSATNAAGTSQSSVALTVNASFTQSLSVWGDNTYGQTVLPVDLSNIVATAGGGYHGLALRADGTVVAWGWNPYGATTIPAGLNNVVAVAGGEFHSLALKSDGTVAAWGRNNYGQTTIPGGLNGVVAIAAGSISSLALKSDGTVVAWGYSYSQPAVPVGLSDVVAIAGGYYFNMALKSDGTVVSWGDNTYGQATVPAGLNGVAAIAAGSTHALALKSDGTVVGWGYNTSGQVTIPAALSNVVAIAGGYAHSLALKSDGTVVGWGWNGYGQTTNPAALGTVVAIAAENFDSIALVRANPGDSSPVVINPPFALAGVNAAFNYRVRSLNSPTSYAASGLPAGLSIDASTGLITGTPVVTGTFPVVLSATNGSGTGQLALALTINGTATPLQAWRQLYWPSNPIGPDTADLANPKGDGVPNLLKFALGLNPLQVDIHIVQSGTGTTGLPSGTNAGTIAQPLLRLEYVRLTQGGITYVPEFSSDLQTWTVAPAGQITVQTVDASHQRVIVTDSPPGEQRRFGRVRVTNP